MTSSLDCDVALHTVTLLNTRTQPHSLEQTKVWVDNQNIIRDLNNLQIVPLYPISERIWMYHPTSLYELESLLGQGTYAQVYGAIEKATGRRVAIKVIQMSGKEEDTQSLMKEITISQSCSNSPFLVPMYDAFVVGSQLWIVMEHCSVGTLENLIQSTQPFSVARTAAVVKMLLYGLLDLHHSKKIHRDIKGANVLIDDNGLFKLADFGLTAVLRTNQNAAVSLCGMLSLEQLPFSPQHGLFFNSTQLNSLLSNPFQSLLIGTPYFLAPEVCKQQPYDYKTDVWSLGILTYYMLTGSVPAALRPLNPTELLHYIPQAPSSDFELPGKPSENYQWTHQSEHELQHNLGARQLKLGQNWPSDLTDFLRCCLNPNPKERWNVSQLLQHRFIFDVPRFVQPSRAKSQNQLTVEPHSLPVSPDTIQLATISRPTHNAWPNNSSLPSCERNLGVYLKTDDYAFGATVDFALNLIPQLPTHNNLFSPEAKLHVLRQVSRIDHLSCLYPGQTPQYSSQILYNRHVQELYLSLQRRSDELSTDVHSYVCLGKVDIGSDTSYEVVLDKDETPKAQRFLPAAQDTPSKQQKISTNTTTPHSAYNLNPNSTQSGNIKDIQQSNNQ